jgi:F plasmid transfer operon, TraF, protein
MKQTVFTKNKLAKGVALAVLLGTTANAVAGYQGHQPGPVQTLGKTSNPNTLLSIANNPAAGELLIGDEEAVRFGYFSSIGFGVELGDLDNVDTDIEELEDLLEDDPANPMTLDRALTAKSKFDTLLPELGDKMNIAWDMGLHMPFFPIAVRSDLLGGVVGLNLSAGLLTDIIFLDAPMILTNTGSEISLSTESSLYVKAAGLVTGTIGYSREVWQPPAFDSKIYGGVNVNVYHATLNKQVVSFEAVADDSSDDDIMDVVMDEFEENNSTVTAVGVDLGAIWAFPNAQVGLTIANINEPEFDYGQIGFNCSSLTGLRQKNCLAAQAFSSEISLKETAVLNAQTTIEGSIYTEDRMFMFSGAYDVNSAFNMVGRESQMLSAAVNFFPNSYIVPSLRLSASKNLAGSELTTIGVGTTLFGMLNLDLAGSLDMIEYDGNKAPRYFGFNIGLEEKF